MSTQKPSTKATLLVLFVFFLMIAGCIRMCSSDSSDKPKTAKQARQEMIKKNFSAWDGSHRNLTAWIKKQLNDPGSYEQVETSYLDYGNTNIVVTQTFSAKNAFGGRVKNKVVMRTDSAGDLLELLNWVK